MTRTIFDALKGANERGAKSVNIVVGQDRQKEFENLANKYNNKLYKFDRINVYLLEIVIQMEKV